MHTRLKSKIRDFIGSVTTVRGVHPVSQDGLLIRDYPEEGEPDQLQ